MVVDLSEREIGFTLETVGEGLVGGSRPMNFGLMSLRLVYGNDRREGGSAQGSPPPISFFVIILLEDCLNFAPRAACCEAPPLALCFVAVALKRARFSLK